MLARLAENLYWMGRYMERVEYVGRYLKVQYFSTLDAPIEYDKFFTLSAIINITGSDMEITSETNEQDVLFEVVFNKENPSSLLNTINQFRHNAKSIRTIISNELWESINTFFHFVNNYDVEYFKRQGLYDFTNAVSRNSAIFRALLDGTMLHDDVWSFIRLGIHTEGVTQTTRVISNKLFDINVLKKGAILHSEENYQWLTTLKILAGLDMSRRVYKRVPNKLNTIDFLITNTLFPRSVVYNLMRTHDFIRLLLKSYDKYSDKNSLGYTLAKLSATYRFLEISKVSDIEELLDQILQEMGMVHQEINSKFFEN